MEFVPLHLFDFVTLCRLKTLNADLNRNVSIELLKRDRTSDLLEYIASLRRHEKASLLYRIHINDVWNMFATRMHYYGYQDYRYVYIASPEEDHVMLHTQLTASHPHGMALTTQSQVHIGVMPFIFGDAVLDSSFAGVISRCWNVLYMMAQNISHGYINNMRIITWDAWNLRLCKIDTKLRKLYISELFPLSTDIIFSHIPFWFTRYASDEVIRSVVFSLLM